jgi:uncharacterized protein with HEPN domain
VERSVGIIGEAANRVSTDFRAKYPEVPWRKAAAQGHVLVHEYGDVNQTLLWSLIADHLPRLISQLEVILAEQRDVSAGR